MQSRVFSFVCALCLLLGAVGAAKPAASQIRAAAAPPAKGSPHAAVSADTPSLSLNLCVDGSDTYPCPNPILSDNVYIRAIALTYGQVLDGVVVYSPPTLNSGTIIIYKDSGAGRSAICTLRIGVDLSCPANSTVFDVDTYTLSATLTFPPGSPYPDFDTSVGPCTTTPTCDVAVTVSKDTTEVAVSSSQPVATLGSEVVLSGTVTSHYGATPNGQVTFTIDNNTVGPIDLDATGAARFTALNLSLGTHSITASYPGALNFYPAADSPVFKQLIVPPPSITAVTSSLNPSALGDNVTFTASVAPGFGGSGGLSGTVTFRDGNIAFSTRPVIQRGGQYMAQANISTLAFGSHNITATYSGDGSNTSSVSPAYVQQVNYPLAPTPPGYKIMVTPSPLALGVGQTAQLTVTVVPISGFSAPVTLSCSDLPSESACTFGDGVIPAGGGSTTLSFSTMAPHDCNSTTPYFTGLAALHRPGSPGLRMAAPLLAGILLLLLPRRRGVTRWMRPLLSIVFAGGLLSLTGCGGACTDFGTPPADYTFKVNGSAPASSGTTSGTSGTTGGSTLDVTTSVALSVKL